MEIVNPNATNPVDASIDRKAFPGYPAVKGGLLFVQKGEIASNTDWTANAAATPGAAPGLGRILQGFVQVKAGSVVAGQAEVDLHVH